MIYVLLYVDDNNQPRVIQGTLERVNKQLHDLWVGNHIDHDDWENYENWTLMSLEENRLTTVTVAECIRIPQILVD